MISPQEVPRKYDPEDLFPNIEAVRKQNDILDSLQGSLETFKKSPKIAEGAATKIENPFNLEITLCPDQLDRVSRFYKATRKDMHVCSHLKVKSVYCVKMLNKLDSFNKKAEELKKYDRRNLWHGSSDANILSILKNGLKKSPPSTASIAGKMFGNGVYFAIDSTKSLNYSHGWWSGQRKDHCFMFLADVLLGNYFVPDGTRSCDPPKGYHSYWAQSGKSSWIKNDEIVVFDDDMFNLQYLVEFDA